MACKGSGQPLGPLAGVLAQGHRPKGRRYPACRAGLGEAPTKKSQYIRRIKEIQSGSEQAHFAATVNLTDKTMAEMFTVFGEDIDITKADPGL